MRVLSHEFNSRCIRPHPCIHAHPFMFCTATTTHEVQVQQYDVGVAMHKRHRPVHADFVRKHRADLLAVLKPILGSVKFRSLLSSEFDQFDQFDQYTSTQQMV